MPSVTELIVARLAGVGGRTPALLFAEFDVARSAVTSALVAAAIDYLRAALTGLVDLTGVDPLADVMVTGGATAGGNVLGAKVWSFLVQLSTAETTLEAMGEAIAGGTDTTALAPKISGDPTSLTAGSPGTATFAVLATSVLKPACQWQVSTDGGASYSDIAGATSDSYALAATQTDDSGKLFRARVSNANASRTSAAATLTASVAPSIESQPTNRGVTAPAAATFTVTAIAMPAPSYQWQRSTDGGATYVDIPGATTDAYTTPATTTADDGSRFRVMASNSAGSATSAVATLSSRRGAGAAERAGRHGAAARHQRRLRQRCHVQRRRQQRRADGSTWAWGSNVYLQLGDMSTVEWANPVQSQVPAAP